MPRRPRNRRPLRRRRLRQPQQVLDLLGRQRPGLPDAHPAQRHPPDPGPHQFADAVPKAGEHAADLPVAAFADGDLDQRPVPVALQEVDLGGAGAALGQVNAMGQPPHGLAAYLADDGGQVRLGHLEPRVRQALGKVAVVGHQQGAARVGIEPAHREEARPRMLHEVDGPLAAGGIVVGADDARRLVEEPVLRPLLVDAVAVEADVLRLGVGLGPEFGDGLPVDRHAARQDDLLAGPPRGHAGVGQDFVKAFERHGPILPRKAKSARKRGG